MVAGSSPVCPATKKHSEEGVPGEKRGALPCADFSENGVKNYQSAAKLPHEIKGQFLKIGEVATLLKISKDTVFRWCQSGKLPAISKPYGKGLTYLISPGAVDVFKLQQERLQEAQQETKTKPQDINHALLVRSWLKSLENGSFNGRPFSRATINDYQSYVDRYFQRYQALTIEGLSKELSRYKPNQYAAKEHLFKALYCFAKHLEQRRLISSELLEALQTIKPKGNPNPKRSIPKESEMEALLNSPIHGQDRLIILMLLYTGLRVSELCQVKWEHLNLNDGLLTVAHGKGNKSRLVGLNQTVLAFLKGYQCEALNPYLLSNRLGRPMNRSGVSQRLERICKEVGLPPISAHALRRAFATRAAVAGRPLPMLQRVLGHSSVRTTEQYIRVTSLQAAEEMKDWD